MKINCAFSQDSVDNVTTTEHSCAAPHTDVVGDAQIFVQAVTNLDSQSHELQFAFLYMFSIIRIILSKRHVFILG